HQAFGERAVIMAAGGLDRKDLAARLDQQHVFLADMAEQLAVLECGEGYAFGQIRSARLAFLAHGHLPRSSTRSSGLDGGTGEKFLRSQNSGPGSGLANI